MKRILFASDLDNTLIHSYKHREESDICAELYQNREQSFMSSEAAELFRKMIQQKNICFLPVTTRSVAQYQRIFFPEGYRPEFALTANGHILLVHDEIESEWYSAAKEKSQPYLSELERFEGILLEDERFRHVSIADGMFIACACETAELADACLKAYQHSTILQAFRTGRKVYFFQPGSDKGTALQQFIHRNAFDLVIAAGDSEMDIPMLNHADIRLFRGGNRDFSAYILHTALEAAYS